MNSEDLKTEAMAWLRYLRRCDMVCTEVGRYNADVWGLTDKRLIEIEVKVSLSDLKADFNKQKHALYNRYALEEGGASQIPSAFYFAMPPELLGPAKAFLATVELPVVKKYGILTAHRLDGYLGRNMAAVQKAGRLHGQPPSAGARADALMRMASELCGTRKALSMHRRHMESGLLDLTNTLKDLYTWQRQKENEELEEKP